MKTKQLKVKSAWLVTWDWVGDHAKVEDPVAAILNYRTSPEKVRRFAELLYASEFYSHGEKLLFAKDRKRNPYPAEFGAVNGVPWQGQITCGHNPWLFARLVKNLSIEIDEQGEEQLDWNEVAKPTPENLPM